MANSFQTVGVKLEGIGPTVRALDRFKRGVRNTIVRKAARAWSKPIRKAVRAGAPKRSGALKQSTGVRVKTYKNGTTVAFVGPKLGFRKGKNVPQFYAHLPEFGFTHRSGRKVQGQLFMTKAHRSAGGAGLQQFKSKLAVEVQREALKQLAKQGSR